MNFTVSLSVFIVTILLCFWSAVYIICDPFSPIFFQFSFFLASHFLAIKHFMCHFWAHYYTQLRKADLTVLKATKIAE